MMKTEIAIEGSRTRNRLNGSTIKRYKNCPTKEVADDGAGFAHPQRDTIQEVVMEVVLVQEYSTREIDCMKR